MSRQTEVMVFVIVFVTAIWISAMTIECHEEVDLQETTLHQMKEK